MHNVTDNEQLESNEEEEVKEVSVPTVEEALKAADLLSRFVHSTIESDDTEGHISDFSMGGFVSSTTWWPF